MRVSWIALYAVAIGAFSTTATAAPSTDLVFCSKMQNKAERIACYDAAARIAETKLRSNPTVVARPVTTVPVQPAHDAYASKAPALVETRRNPFHGAYAAIGGSYGLSSDRNSFSSFSSPPVFTSTSVSVHPSGPSAVATIGYNLAFERWLIGIELDGRWGAEQARISAANNVCCTLLTATQTYQYNNDAAVHVSGRIGASIDDTLIFAKLGLGGSHITEKYTYTDTVRFAAIMKSIWVPSAIFGVGIEQNFGRAFARVSAELEAISAASLQTAGSPLSGSSFADGASWTARGSGMIGVRF